MTFFITLAVIDLLAQTEPSKFNFNLSGIVKEKGSGETLPNATIVLKYLKEGTNANADGYFTLFNVPSDTTTIEVSYVGYKTLTLKLNSNMKLEPLLIELKEATVELSEVIVSAYNYSIMNASEGISSARLSPKQLSLLPVVGEEDIFRSLQLLPGVSGTNESSSGLFVRGGTPDQNLVLLDGMTVYNVDHFFGFFSAFNTSAIKDVKLYKGGFPAKYGGRTSSVIELTGKTGDVNHLKGAFGMNLLSGNGHLEIPIKGKGSFLISVRRSYTDIVRSKLFTNIFDVFNQNNPEQAIANASNLDTREVIPDFYYYDVNSKLSFRPSLKDNLSLSLYNGQDYLDESRDFTRLLNIPDGTTRNIIAQLDDKTDWGNRGASFKWSRQWDPKFYSNFLIATSTYFSNFNRFFDLDVTIPEEDDSLVIDVNIKVLEDNKVNDRTFRLDNEWQPSKQHKIEFGAWFIKTKIDHDFILNDSITILARKQDANYGSVYFQEYWKPFEGLELSAGLRASYYELSDKYFLEPRASITYKLMKNIKLKGAYGKYYQFINRIINENVSEGSRDFWLLADGDLVNVSSSIHYIAGASFENDWLLFDVEVYHKDINDLSEFSMRFARNPDPDPGSLFFSGDGFAEGVDFLLQKKQGQYNGWLSYSVSRVRYTFPAFNDGVDFPALHDQTNEFKMVHSYAPGDWTFASTFVFGTGKPFTEPSAQYQIDLLDGRTQNYISVGPKNGSRLPAYHRLDLSANYNFKWGEADARLGISIFNAYGRKNIWYKEFDFSTKPFVITNITYLGFTPNLSMNIKF